MKAERRGKEIIVNLSQEEVFHLQAGKTIGDRPGVTMSDAKIEILPLSAIEPDDSLKDKWEMDRLEKAAKAPLRGNLFPNGDLQIIVPAIKLTDVRISSARLSRESIETPMTEDGKGLVEHVIPQEGVQLNFGGSLKIVDIPLL